MLPSPFTLFDSSLLQEIESDFWDFNQTGFSYPELSHRSKHYVQTNIKAIQLIRQYFDVPESHEILLLPSGCGDASVAFNLTAIVEGRCVYWVKDEPSSRAYQESKRINSGSLMVSETQKRISLFPVDSGNFYTYYTFHSFEEGTQAQQLEGQSNEILVCNAGHCFHYTSLDISKHGIVMFETGRGIGALGMHVVIVRKDLLGHHLSSCPDMMDYQKTLKAQSVINTPFTLVVLSISKQLDFYISQGLHRKKVQQQLQQIKREVEKQLKEKVEIIKTELAGVIKIKVPQLSKEKAEQCGVVKGDELLLMLQIPNKGCGQRLIEYLF